ncbi:PLP-dependent aminotransferase family protein [Desulfovibrio sp. DV]|uniref:aminotransferase-like domain-containing protein n=1 Tax=Desulfovibrio sp. DV TaxID=1844708 RepID=UPI00094B81C2|nr:PLP-dependent aminotransferase family protein [Desulfovibrio sp. DV]
MTLSEADAGLFRYVAVEKHIVKLIEAGELKAGERIPSLRALGNRLGVSVSTVNQAYLELERRGMVEARPKSGFFVRQMPPRRAVPQGSARPTAAPTTVTRGALIREVLDGMARRDIVPLGVARTDEALLPTKQLARLLAKVAAGDDRVTSYESVCGNLELRRQIAWRLADAGIEAGAEDVMITSGAMEALYLALRSVTRPGDNVAIPAPTYYCFLQLLENLGLRAVELPSYPDGGVRPAELRQALDRFDLRAVILTPNFNNPDGSLIPDAAKAEMAALLAERGVPVIEDDVYGDLHFTERRPRCLRSFDASGNVLHCSSFSKTLAPGFRLGYMLPGRHAARAFEIKATTNVCCASPTQLTAALYLAQGGFDRHLRNTRSVLERQARMTEERVLRHFPEGTRVTHPAGGSVVWVQMPDSVDSIALFYEAKAQGIGVAPGNIFSSCDQFKHFLRLSYGHVWTPAVEQALATLGRLAQGLSGREGPGRNA